MSLPKIDVPVYTVKLPISQKVIRFRPFLVKEEKILLMAVTADDATSISDAIGQIVNNCVQDDINLLDLPITDFEYLFINIRARSVGEVIELNYECNNIVEGEKCGHVVATEINLLEVYPEIPSIDSKIELFNDIGIALKYPSMNISQKIEKGDTIDNVLGMLYHCYDYIYNSEEIFYSKDVSSEEFMEFIESLPQESFNKILHFFDNLPKLKVKLQFKCDKCGYTEDINLEGIQSFF